MRLKTQRLKTQRLESQRLGRFPASETERASIRALKNWLLTMPPENPFADQIVELRIAAAIATVSSEALDQRVRR
jgi:hypothetical protein